jgi:transcriptional regulator with GAF, ATPase, and Fis domain
MQADLEARLWHIVSEHADLAQCLTRLHAEFERAFACKFVVIRRVEGGPPRLTTTAAVGTNAALELSAQVGQRSELSDGGENLVAQLSTRRRVENLSRLVPHHVPLLVGFLPNYPVWAVPLTSDPTHAAIAFLALDLPETSSHHGPLDGIQSVIEVAYKNDWVHQESVRTREALRADKEALLSRLGRNDINEVIVGETGGLRDIMFMVHQVANTDAPVLVLGETGSGKEVVARAIHERSARRNGPVVRVNCGAIPTELVDSELFGHEKGSFTGAVAARKGWFERADGGTLFLDEVGELPPAAQVRLLRVLQDGSLERVGGHQTVHVDVRIVAATHRDLGSMVAAGTFRQDLWYRLSVFPMRLPPLRERLEDLPALAHYFAERSARRLGVQHLIPTAYDIDRLKDYGWPGNVRELASVIERAAILGGGKGLEVSLALGRGTSNSAPPLVLRQPNGAPASRHNMATLDEVVRNHIRQVLELCHGRIEGPHGAAQVLGINPHTLRARMRKLGITWSAFRPSAS